MYNSPETRTKADDDRAEAIYVRAAELREEFGWTETKSEIVAADQIDEEYRRAYLACAYDGDR